MFQTCSGLSIDLIRRPWEEEPTDSNNTSTTDEASNTTVVDDDTNSKAVELASNNNEEVCQAQKEGVDYQATEEYHTVFELFFFQTLDVSLLYIMGGECISKRYILTSLSYPIDCLEE
jgi:hypothetical protein